MADLKPCPFCGCDNVYVFAGEFVFCTGCRTRGPRVDVGVFSDSGNSADNSWNTRTYSGVQS